MILQDRSSGVYFEEVNLSQVVSPVSTAVGGLVGEFLRGEPNKRILIQNTKQVADRLGNPDPEKLTWPSAYAAKIFSARSSELWVVRVLNSNNSHSYAGSIISTVAGVTSGAAIGSNVPDPQDVSLSVGTQQFYLHCIGPGKYGDNMSYKIRSHNAVSPVPVLTPSATDGTLATDTYSYRVSVSTKIGKMAASAAVTAAVTGPTGSVSIEIPYVENAISYEIYGRVGGSELLITSLSQPSGVQNLVYVDTGAITPAGSFPVTSEETDIFNLDIFDSEVSVTQPIESFEVSLNYQVDGFNNQMEIEEKVNSFSRNVRVIKNPTFASDVLYTTAVIALDDGLDGDAPTVSDISKGWDLFMDKEKVTVRHLINGGVASPVVQAKMQSVCERRGDCTAYFDVPTEYQQAEDALVYVNQILNINSTQAAIYTPDLKINDEDNGRLIFVPPSAHAAAIGAISGLRAPFGLNRGVLNDVLGLRHEYNLEQRNLLAEAKINYVRNYPGRGIAIAEGFTMEAQMSALSWLNVRYTLNLIKPTLEDALDFSVAEYNDDFTRRQIINLVSEFLDLVRDNRAIQDYLVIADDSNNPNIVTTNGQLNVDIYIIPTLPIQRIRARLIVTKQGVNLAEVAAAA